MKHTFAKLFESAKGLSRRRKIIVSGALVVALALPVTVFAATRHDEPKKPQVASESTRGPKNDQGSVKKGANPEEKESAPESATDTQPTATTPKPSTPSVTQSQTPAPQPTRGQPIARLPIAFGVAIDSAAVSYSGPNQFQMPFNIFRGQGHTKTFSSGCDIISAPTSSHGVGCSVVMSEASRGFISVLIQDISPSGPYVCRLTLNDGELVKTAQFSFTVTDTSFTIP